MIQKTIIGADTLHEVGWAAIAIRPSGNMRQLLLVAFTAVTLLAVACGTSDGAATASGPAADQDPTASAAASLTPIGDASEFEVSTPNHGVFNLDRLQGQPVLLNFWYPSCPGCIVELPDLKSAHEIHGDEIQFLGVQLLGLDSAEEGQMYLDELGVTYPSGADDEGQMIRDFKVVSFPTTIFIDRDHNIVKKSTGILSPESIETFIAGTIASGDRLDVSGS